MSNGVVRLAVISDIHTFVEPSRPAPSHLSTSTPENQPTKHPFAGLQALIRKDGLEADVVLCCGDMGDKATPEGIRYTWRWVNDIATELKAKLVVGTAGNHDIDSRGLHGSLDCDSVLRSLVPRFPIPSDQTATDQFWSRHFAILNHSGCRFVVLNSSAHHGTPSEIDHGRVTDDTMASLASELDAGGRYPLNVLLCHHHPYRHGDIDAADYSEMRGAPELINLLCAGRHGPWICIHGHKHHPRVAYAPGPSSSPVIFAAGSLASNLYLELQTRARNQFYILEFRLTAAAACSLSLAAVFRSWDWARALGWVTAKESSGLPSYGGFGCRTDGWTGASQVALMFDAAGSPLMYWEDVLAQFPQFEYLSPADVQQLVEALETRHRISSFFSRSGRLAQIGRLG